MATTALLERATRSGRGLVSIRPPPHGLTVPWREHRPQKQRVVGLLHPVPERRVQLVFHCAGGLVARQVVFLQRVSLDVVELDDARAVGRGPRRVGAKDRALLDASRDRRRGSRRAATGVPPTAWAE